MTNSVLAPFNADREIILYTNISRYASSGILSQKDNKGYLQLYAYFSKKHSPAKLNYDIYDKEMLAIIKYLKE